MPYGFDHGKCLFHYTTSDIAFDKILPDGKLLLSPLEKMRDPLENKRWLFIAAALTPEQQAFNESYLRFDLFANNILKQARLLSLTTDADEVVEERLDFNSGRGWSSASMWERYADQHRGVCLVFDKQSLVEAVSKSLVDQGFPMPYNKAVSYTPAGPREKVLGRDDLDGEVTLQRVARHVEERHADYFYTKSLDWQFEREYRLVVTQPDELEGDVLVDFGESLIAVITGELFPRWQRAGAAAAAKDRDIDSVRLSWEIARPVLTPFRE